MRGFIVFLFVISSCKFINNFIFELQYFFKSHWSNQDHIVTKS